MITVTLNQIKAHSPCASGWIKILAAQGPDMDREFPLADALESNGISDTLWALRCVDGGKQIAEEFARWCALRHVEKIKPYAGGGYDLIVRFLETGENARAAADAADAAARAAADAAYAAYAAYAADAADAADAARAADAAARAARAAAYAADAAVCAAAYAAAYAAARAAAYAAVCAAVCATDAEQAAQAEKLRELLTK